MVKKIKEIFKGTTLILIIINLVIFAMPSKIYAANTDSNILEKQIEKVVNNKVKETDSEKKKLKKLFVYIEKKYDYKRVMGFEAYKGWEKDYALEMYTEKKGSCYHFAAAYAFLANKATGYKVRIVIGKTNGFSGALQEHAWTEINIDSKWYICDSNMDKYAENSSGKYFLKKKSKLKNIYNNYKSVQYCTVIL